MRSASGDDTQDFSALERVLGRRYSVMDARDPEERRSTYDEIDMGAISSGFKRNKRWMEGRITCLSGFGAGISGTGESPRWKAVGLWRVAEHEQSGFGWHTGATSHQCESIGEICGMRTAILLLFQVLRLRPKEIPVLIVPAGRRPMNGNAPALYLQAVFRGGYGVRYEAAAKMTDASR